jgi:hydroxypyruvate reductase
VPGRASRAAAAALAAAVGAVRPGDEVWVLLSGGTSSLAGAPIDGVSPGDYTALGRLLLASGLEIGTMNQVRKRVSRWAGGRLGVALAARGAARIRVYVVSDVVGDSVEAIASGPCAPDPGRAADVRAMLLERGLWHEVPPTVRTAIEDAAVGGRAETPKPDDPAFRLVTHRIVARNRDALEGAAEAARLRGYDVEIAGLPLSGEARRRGEEIARTLVSGRGRPACLLWGGETTVTLDAATDGAGGRCQELALAAAQVLADSLPRATSALLAAGTDGRDGPTDAAGAVVDARTLDRIRRAGRDPARDLEAHRSYDALDAAGALFRPGATGTNVMDVVIGVVGEEGLGTSD